MPRLAFSAAAIIVLVFAGMVRAGDTSVDKYLAAHRNVDQVKTALRATLGSGCEIGNCSDQQATEICNLVGALDVNLGGLITSHRRPTRPNAALPIPLADLQLFSAIWPQCRPTTDQYRRHGTVVHVRYEASARDDALIRHVLANTLAGDTAGASPTRPPPVTIVTILAPTEPDAVIAEEHRTSQTLINDLVRAIRASGHRCDSISSMRPLAGSSGFSMACNRLAHRYDVKGTAGAWQISRVE